tara:strand:- start:4879 stop:5058 length:180 start_codon:yes stop_codon:yes gene_type:complete
MIAIVVVITLMIVVYVARKVRNNNKTPMLQAEEITTAESIAISKTEAEETEIIPMGVKV